MSDAIAIKRTNYLRGIAASATSRKVDAQKVRNEILNTAFNEIADPTDWKNPINVVMELRESDVIGVGLYLEAIEYFTSTKAEIFLISTRFDHNDKQINTYRIVSEGYRLSDAG
jgi:hypothetical protein